MIDLLMIHHLKNKFLGNKNQLNLDFFLLREPHYILIIEFFHNFDYRIYLIH